VQRVATELIKLHAYAVEALGRRPVPTVEVGERGASGLVRLVPTTEAVIGASEGQLDRGEGLFAFGKYLVVQARAETGCLLKKWKGFLRPAQQRKDAGESLGHVCDFDLEASW